MEKLILKSLELAGFKNASVISQVISATPNPRVATEMILGIHEPISLSDFGMHWKQKYDDAVYQVYDIDELKDEVYCHKSTQKHETFYYLTSDDYENRTNRVAVKDKKPGSRYYDWRSEPVPGVYTETKTFKLDGFTDNSMTHISYDEFAGFLDKWIHYTDATVNSEVTI
jgi:hypothetical protein